MKTYRKVEAPKRLVELVDHCLDKGLMTDRILKAAVRCEVSTGAGGVRGRSLLA